MDQRRTGTWAAVGVALLLAACSSSPAPAPTPTDPATAAMVARHPSCAGHTTTGEDAGVACAVEGHLYVVYVLEDQAAADAAAVSLRVLHPTGTVDVEGTTVWVTE